MLLDEVKSDVYMLGSGMLNAEPDPGQLAIIAKLYEYQVSAGMSAKTTSGMELFLSLCVHLYLINTSKGCGIKESSNIGPLNSYRSNLMVIVTGVTFIEDAGLLNCQYSVQKTTHQRSSLITISSLEWVSISHSGEFHKGQDAL
ncbi:hypothetical protein Tco_0583803 [Tanacetum coccineum]